MDPKILTFFVLTAAAIVMVTAQKPLQGNVTVDGVTCRYFETRKKGRGKRGISLCCENAKKQCEYFGANPHKCGNKYNNNQKKYYENLAKAAMEKGAPCAKIMVQESICGLSYPCKDGDCLKKGLNNREQLNHEPLCSNMPAADEDIRNGAHSQVANKEEL